MHHRHRAAVIGTALIAMALCGSAAAAEPKRAADPLRDRGRYIAIIGGCNDCHTANYALSGGKVDEKEWLMGDSLGWRGPWGTTYPVNLRLYMENISEKEWVEKAKKLETRPPMPWFNLNRMADNDLRALYRFVRSLEPAGNPAPAYVPPTQEPKPPYITFPAPPK